MEEVKSSSLLLPTKKSTPNVLGVFFLVKQRRRELRFAKLPKAILTSKTVRETEEAEDNGKHLNGESSIGEWSPTAYQKNSTRKGVVFFVAVIKTRTPVRKIAKGNSDE